MEGQKSKEEKVDFEELLNHIGGWGKFQIRLTAVFVYFTFFLAYVGYTPILYLYTPDHWCKIPLELQIKFNVSESDLIPKNPDGSRNKCYMFDIQSSEDLKSDIIPKSKCLYGYEYNYTEYFKSATSQFDWVCDEEWKPAFTQSIFYGGAIIGQTSHQC